MTETTTQFAVDWQANYQIEGEQFKEGIRLGSIREEVEAIYGELEWDGIWLINSPPYGIYSNVFDHLTIYQR